jgi:hypothetical protein
MMKITRFAKLSFLVCAALLAGQAAQTAQTAHAQDIGLTEPMTATAPQNARAAALVYLPITVRAPAATVANGDFEAGRTAWIEHSNKGALPLIRTTFTGGLRPRSGAHAAWLGGVYSDIQYLEQMVAVPSNQSYLAYWHWIASSDFCGYDYVSIRANGAEVAKYDLCSSTNTSAWTKKTFNLSAYAGQQVMLQIRVRTDSSKNSNFFLDDVAFQAGTNAATSGADDGRAEAEIQVESFTQDAPAEKPMSDLPEDAASALKPE